MKKNKLTQPKKTLKSGGGYAEKEKLEKMA